MKAYGFTLPASNGKNISLSDYKGKAVILYFYPKDATPGCTTEACDFRDSVKKSENEDAVILGISVDSVNSHEKFIEKNDLPFLLLSDENHEVCEKYDVWKLKKNYGKEYMGIERSTFLIDKDQNIVKEWRKVRVNGHVSDVMEELNKLCGSSK